jgi:hypothetical protein
MPADGSPLRWLWQLILLTSATMAVDARAQSPDTTAVLRVVRDSMRADAAREDSAKRARCAEDAVLCPAAFPGRPRWYVAGPPEQSVLVERLAALDSMPTQPDGPVPPACPWPATAPKHAGYRVKVALDVHRADSLTVSVALACDNPRGYLHDIYRLERDFVLTRDRGRWSVVFVQIRVT